MRTPWFLLLSLALPALARAHPIHTSFAEADYNRTTHTLEVALRVFADDFETTLAARAKKKISLGKTPAAELNALARAYLLECFTVRLRDGKPAELQWIGREHKETTNELWLFFEFALPDGVEGIRIRHAVLGEQFSDQLNSVHLRDGPRQATLLFFPDRGERLVRLK